MWDMLNVYSIPFWYLFPCLGLSYGPSGKSAYTQLSFLQHCILKILIYIGLSRFLSPSSQLKRPLVSTWIPAHYTWNVSRDYGQLYGSSHLVFPSTQITILKRLMSSVWNLLLHTTFVQMFVVSGEKTNVVLLIPTWLRSLVIFSFFQWWLWKYCEST